MESEKGLERECRLRKPFAVVKDLEEENESILGESTAE